MMSDILSNINIKRAGAELLHPNTARVVVADAMALRVARASAPVTRTM